MDTVTMGDLGPITGRTRDAIRNMQNRGCTPWDDEALRQPGKVRRYSGEHALALVVCEMFEAQGFNVADAAEFVRAQSRVIALFLDELEQAPQAPQPRFVVALLMAVSDGLTAARWEKQIPVGYGTKAETEDLIIGNLERVGREVATRQGATSKRYIGGPHVAVAPVAEAYRLLTERARAAGYVIEGRRIGEVR